MNLFKNFDTNSKSVEVLAYEKEKQDFIRAIGVSADYDINGVKKGEDGIWRIHDKTADEWREYLKN